MNKILLRIIIIGVSCFVLFDIVFGVIFLTRKISVPDVTGKYLDEAIQILEDSYLKVEYSLEYSDDAAKNIVILQDTEAGTKLKKGSVVHFTVSAGKEPVSVPSVVNIPDEKAEKILLDLDFTVIIKEAFSDDFEKGIVVLQSVKAGRIVDKGSDIEIVISRGPELIEVPDVTGKPQAEAVEIMLNAGLVVDTDIQCSDTVPEGIIISQDTLPGEMIRRNSTVLIYVSAGVSNAAGNTPSNSVNRGLVAVQNDWIYYSNVGNDYSLYKMRTDGSERQLLTDGPVTAINVVGDWIYYNDDSSPGLFKIKIDGSDKTRLSSDINYWVYVADGYIYYAESSWSGNIFRMKTDGTGKEKVCDDDCSHANVVGDWIYYINRDDRMTYKIRTDGTERTMLPKRFSGSELVVDGSAAFCSNGSYDLYKIYTDGSGFSHYKENHKIITYINANNGWLYFLELDFSGSTERDAFYKMRYDLSQKTKIMDLDFRNTPNYFINVTGDWLYFPNEDDNSCLYRIKTDGTELQKVHK